MGYKSTHPKKIRGKPITETFDEKLKEREKMKKEFGDLPPEAANEILSKKYVSENGRIVRGNEVLAEKRHEDKWHKDKSKKAKEEFLAQHPELIREAIESTYLVPEVDNFVETNAVKKIEDRIKLWLTVGYPVHIIGPTGCGKTTIAMKVAKDLERSMVWINGDESVTTTDLIGGYSQVAAESLRDRYIHNVFKSKDILKADWVDNPLTLACKYGYTLVYNEFSRTKPEANNILLSVLEEGILELPTKFGEERYVHVHPDFSLIVTSNSVEYAGIHRPQDALLDRMIGVYMDFYDFDTEVEIVKTHTDISTEEAKKIVGVVRALREKLPEAENPGTRACIMIGQGLQALDGYSKDDFEHLCVDVLTSKTKGPSDLSEKQKLVKDTFKELET